MTENKVFLNDQDIVEIHVVGDQTYDSVMQMGNQARVLLTKLEKDEKPGLILDNITKLGGSDTAARQAVKDLAQDLPFEKTAMLGTKNLLLSVGTKILLQAIGQSSKIKYFDSLNAAVTWLKK